MMLEPAFCQFGLISKLGRSVGGWDRAKLLLKKKFDKFQISCTCKIHVVKSCALVVRGREIRTILLFMLMMFLF